MSNTTYIDCNRNHANHNTTNNNEWTYKLNTELLLPKGTEIQVQESFVNKKGINGGSIEIDEDIIEEITYTYYITEEPHYMGEADHGADPTIPWYRSTLGIDVETFRGNFDNTLDTEAEINKIVQGYWLRTGANFATTPTPASYNGIHKTPDFSSFGGCNQVLPHVKLIADPAAQGGFRLMPDIKTLTFSIPKGVYGVGEISQLIEDQFNGVKYYDTFSNKIIEQNDVFRRQNNLALYNTTDEYDGQFFNGPFVQLIDSVARTFSTSRDDPITDDFFLCGADYNDLMIFLRDKAITTASALAQQTFDLKWIKGNPTDDVARAADPENKKIRPFYSLRLNYDDGTNTSLSPSNAGHVKDANATGSEYWLYQYNDEEDLQRRRMIGTSNFSIKYDTENNGYSINGLHNVKRSSSHDRFGSKMESAGQPVINFKKCRRGAFDGTWSATPAKKLSKKKALSALNTPETRDMGIMIINWASKTTGLTRTTKNEIFTPNCARFGDYYDTIQNRDENWKKTIWHRLGFDYDQLNDVSTHTNFQYNKQVYTDYGFTTNVNLTNDIIPTISTLSNPNEFKPKNPEGGAGNEAFTSGFQFYTMLNYAMPFSPFNTEGCQGLYASSLFAETATYPVIISDVGGVIANRLPSLTKHPYYLITCDVCDNYKDNVKKGDVLPLLGVVPKTSLSNQDFIASENQIVQVLSQDKVINKIHIKILNPDLTNPVLDPNSSVILKLTVPNKTPLSLLEQNPANKKLIEQIIATQNELVGN